MRRAVGVDGEGDAHLSGGDCQSFCREKPGVGIQHLDLAFVGEVYLGFVGYAGQYVARHADAGIAYFETSCTHGGLIFVFGADGSVDFRQVVFGFHLLLFNLFSVLVDGGRLGNCGQRQQGNQYCQCTFFHNLLLSNDLSATKFGHTCCVFVSYMLHCCYKKLLEGRTAMGAVLIFLWLDLVSCFY